MIRIPVVKVVVVVALAVLASEAVVAEGSCT